MRKLLLPFALLMQLSSGSVQAAAGDTSNNFNEISEFCNALPKGLGNNHIKEICREVKEAGNMTDSLEDIQGAVLWGFAKNRSNVIKEIPALRAAIDALMRAGAGRFVPEWEAFLRHY